MHFADDKTNKEENNGGSTLQPQDNPYARKEVSYVCETGDELCMVVGGIFRRVREARELGESHGKSADLRMGECMCVLSFIFMMACLVHVMYVR